MSLLSSLATADETPVDRYLADQADLTAVERFSQRHEHTVGHQQARYYRDLIPLNRPAPGQQYAFEVDLDSCTGCKACVTACHTLNGLDEGEAWRAVTLLRGGTPAEPFQQSVTAACHHCLDPMCLQGCPVDAYEKDPVTGIVAHLDDQCIGCSYCTLTCPYEVPAFSEQRGIVRKCDMCKDRLAVGEAPACVQACPNGAITITLADTADAAPARATLVPGAPPSSITRPTTVYRTARPGVLETTTRLDSGQAAASAVPAHAHNPLAVMLVLTQLSVGAFVTDVVLRVVFARSASAPLHAFVAVLAAATGLLALAASLLHLGRPRYCYRAVIGLRHSWLSREIVAFGGFAGLAALYALVVGLRWPVDGTPAANVLGGGVAALGLAGIGCSVMIYAITRRSAWRAVRLVPKFAATAAMCGPATVVWASIASEFVAADGSSGSLAPLPAWLFTPLLAGITGLATVKLIAESSVLRHRSSSEGAGGERARVAALLGGALRATAVGRFVAGVIGGVLLPLILIATYDVADGPSVLTLAVATGLVVALTAGELIERSLFFTTSSPPR